MWHEFSDLGSRQLTDRNKNFSHSGENDIRLVPNERLMEFDETVLVAGNTSESVDNLIAEQGDDLHAGKTHLAF